MYMYVYAICEPIKNEMCNCVNNCMCIILHFSCRNSSMDDSGGKLIEDAAKASLVEASVAGS